MDVYPATSRVIKAGRSETPFLLFFGNRKQDENEPVKPAPTVLAAVLLILVTAILGICIYAFLTGKLG
jgi:predicted permease